MQVKLSDQAVKLLALIQEKHDAMHFMSAHGAEDGKPFVQVILPVEEMNKIAQGMATLASLIALNPTYVTQEMEVRKNATNS